MPRRTYIKLIKGREWKSFRNNTNRLIKRLPLRLSKHDRNIAIKWMNLLKAKAPRFAGALVKSINLRKRIGPSSGRTIFHITVGAPHAYELVNGPLTKRPTRIYRDMIGFGGKPFGQWMDEKGFPRELNSILVGFGPTTMFGKYLHLWWDPVHNEMTQFIDSDFNKLSKEVEKELKKL